MTILKSLKEMQNVAKNLTGTIGFVPTMGYLHEGHLELVKCSKAKADFTIVSIYVNPTQFAPNEDLDSYPRDIDRDKMLLQNLDVDFLFFPSDAEMYPNDYKTWVDVGKITQILCGASRPTHFKGVTTIVLKLLNLTKADYIFMGEKDYQQLTVIKQMVKDLNIDTSVIGCLIVRESDGLAMSSRNKYLNGDERKRALCLYKSLLLAKKLYKTGKKNPLLVKKEMIKLIEKNRGKIDYIEFVDADNLEIKKNLDDNTRVAIAVKIGKTRLIDNIKIEGD